MAPKANPKSKAAAAAPASSGDGAAAAARAGQKQQARGKVGGEKLGSTAGTAAAPTGPSVQDLLKTMDRHIKAGDFKKIVKVADQILQQVSGDKDALECKVVAYIELEEFDQALTVIDSAPGIDLTFHKAYCLYKRNRAQEALDSLRNAERKSSVLQLEAQILFKMGNFGASTSTYLELLEKHKVDSDEVKSNVVAAYVSAGRSKEVPALMGSMKVLAKSNFNLAYNAACALIETGEFSKAEEHLLLARRLGQEAYIEDELPEEEIEAELAPISVQLSYVHQVQGHSSDALDGYNSVLKKKLTDDSSTAVATDEASMAVASNNLVALRGARDLFDGIKKFDKLFEKKGGGQRVQLTEKLEQRLSHTQKEALSFNRFLLLLHSNKLDQARELLPSLLDSFPQSELPSLLAASLAAKEGKTGRAEDVLEQFASNHPENQTAVFLVLAQVSASAGNFARAAESLEKIVELQHKPGMVATLVALRERAGDVDKAETILDEAVEWWDNHMSEEDTTPEEMIKEAAAFKLKHNKLDEAAKLFHRLTKSSSPVVRAEALNGLVCSTALSDPKKAEFYEKQLPPLPGVGSIDAEALQRAGPPTSKRARAADDDAKTGDEKADRTKPKKKKKRKPLYPKNFDPANPGPPPDPERWLPKRERSSFKPKKKDKRAQQQQIRGAQGSVTRDRAGDTSGQSGPSQASSGTGKAVSSSTSKNTTASSSTTEPPKPPPSSSHRNKKKGRR